MTASFSLILMLVTAAKGPPFRLVLSAVSFYTGTSYFPFEPHQSNTPLQHSVSRLYSCSKNVKAYPDVDLAGTFDSTKATSGGFVEVAGLTCSSL